MKKNTKMWAILLHLSPDMWWDTKYNYIPWDDATWDLILKNAVDAGFNTIVLDVGNGVEFSSHPELAISGTWPQEKLRKEIRRCNELGIAVIPKLNFSTTHDKWLGKYARMISTEEYYCVCDDLIKEVYELFNHPQYIHIGMDEENDFMQRNETQIVIYRRDELLWHDLRFLVDSVKAAGATPWIWHDLLFGNPEEFKKRFDPKELLVSPWYYRSFHEEHFEPMPDERQEEFGNLNLTYLEEGHFFANFRKQACPLANYGFRYVPTASAWSNNPYNAYELMEHFENGAPDESIVGYMTAPWSQTVPERVPRFEKSFQWLKEAREKFYRD